MESASDTESDDGSHSGPSTPLTSPNRTRARLSSSSSPRQSRVHALRVMELENFAKAEIASENHVTTEHTLTRSCEDLSIASSRDLSTPDPMHSFRERSQSLGPMLGGGGEMQDVRPRSGSFSPTMAPHVHLAQQQQAMQQGFLPPSLMKRRTSHNAQSPSSRPSSPLVHKAKDSCGSPFSSQRSERIHKGPYSRSPKAKHASRRSDSLDYTFQPAMLGAPDVTPMPPLDIAAIDADASGSLEMLSSGSSASPSAYGHAFAPSPHVPPQVPLAPLSVWHSGVALHSPHMPQPQPMDATAAPLSSEHTLSPLRSSSGDSIVLQPSRFQRHTHL